MTIKLTFPRSHKPKDLKPLYEEFKALHPDKFNTWEALERGQTRF